MKINLLPANRHNDLHIDFDVDNKKYVVTVSTNRLPDGIADFKKPQEISGWTKNIQENLKKIGLDSDGKVFVCADRPALDECVESLHHKGYRLDKQWSSKLDQLPQEYQSVRVSARAPSSTSGKKIKTKP